MSVVKIPDGLTVRVTTNAKKKATTILAYRKGGFKRAYKAVLPMCSDEKCRVPYGPARLSKPHTKLIRGVSRFSSYKAITEYHPSDVDALVVKIVKSYK